MHPTLHRVIANRDKERYTVGLYTFNEGMICVPDELVDNKNPLRYKPLNHHDFLKQVMYHAEKKIGYSLEDYCGT